MKPHCKVSSEERTEGDSNEGTCGKRIQEEGTATSESHRQEHVRIVLCAVRRPVKEMRSDKWGGWEVGKTHRVVRPM